MAVCEKLLHEGRFKSLFIHMDLLFTVFCTYLLEIVAVDIAKEFGAKRMTLQVSELEGLMSLSRLHGWNNLAHSVVACKRPFRHFSRCCLGC